MHPPLLILIRAFVRPAHAFAHRCVDPAQVIAGFAAAMPAPVPPMSVLSFGSCPADASNAVLTLSVGSADNCDDAAAAQTYVAAVNTSVRTPPCLPA